MCRVFIPEDYFACGDGLRDDLPAFRTMIAAMEDGDVAQLAAKTYRLEGTLHVDKRIAIVGEVVSPHYGVHKSRLLFLPDTLGLRLLRGATVRDLAVTALPAGTDGEAHGIWCRRTAHLQNIFIQGFGGHGVSLDSRTIERVVDSISVEADAESRSIATAAVADNTGLLSFLPDMEILLYGYTVSTPSGGGIVLSASAGAVEFELPGTPSGPLTGITLTINSASVSVVDNVRQCTVNVGPDHGLLPNMHITTTDAIDTPILSVHRDGLRVTFALTGNGPGPVQGDSLTVVRGLLRTNQNCDHWFAENVRAYGNRGHGWHTVGARSNAGCAINLDCTNNYQSGVHEESFLGNTYVACHTSGNSRSRGPQEPPWPSYNKPATADNNRSKFYNCYSEGSAPAEVWYPASVLAPGPGNWIGSGLAGVFDTSYALPTTFLHHNPDFNNDLEFEIGGTRNTFFAMRAQDNSSSRRYWMQYLRSGNQSTVFRMNYNNDNGATPFALTGERTSDSEGRIGPGQFWMPNGFFFGNTNPFTKQVAVLRGSASQGCYGIEFWMPIYNPTTRRTTRAVRFLGWREQIPTDGDYLAGDRILNASPAVGQPKSWVCTVAGGPGVFVFTSEGNL
ncbi:MAG TPA: hypothetical protein VGX68_27965 [Thermoanaerobaculia bacterium]|jgi:hypothetical protein|nr:hypothetical protein [Thermoanaerobaculia bacterium]